jgi:hypothetical protein
MIWPGIALGVAAAVQAPPSANPFDKVPMENLAAIAFMKGKCGRLVIAGRDRTARCQEAIVNDAWKNGRSSFIFSAKGWGMVSFYGVDSKAVGDEAVLHLDTILITLEGPAPVARQIRATGRCTYTNPYTGPSRIHCAATAGGKRYEAAFVSDGTPPDIHRP